MPKLHHFAVHIEELVELHFVPLEEPKVAGGVGVFPAEGQPGFPHSLESNALDGVAGGIEHFHFGIQRRLAAGGVDFHHPLFAGLGGEPEHVCVVLFLAINHAGDFGWRADGHRRPWIVVGFFLGKFRLVKRGLGGDLRRLCLGEGRLRLGQAQFIFLKRTIHPADVQRVSIVAKGQGGNDIRLAGDDLQWLKAWQRPNFHRPIGGGGGQARARLVDRDVGNFVLVRIANALERIDFRLVAAYPFPHADLFVGTGSDDVSAVRRECGDELFASGLAECVEPLAGGGVPELYRRVATGAGQHLAVRAEGDAVHGSVVALERVQQLAGFCVPKLDEPIVAGSAQALAVRRKRNPIQGIAMALAEFANAISGIKIEQNRDTVQAGNTGGDCQPFGVRRNGDGVHFAGNPLERLVAELNFAITPNSKLPV